MTTETQAEFARRLKVNRSTINRWAGTGRVVMDGDRVDVERSLEMIERTSGARPDVADRHAAARGSPLRVSDGGGPPAADPAADKIGSSYQTARAVKEKYNALAAKLDYERSVGSLIPKEDVDAALKAMGASVRARLDVLADQLAPVVAPVVEMDEVHALLAEHFRAVLAGIAGDLQRMEVCQ